MRKSTIPVRVVRGRLFRQLLAVRLLAGLVTGGTEPASPDPAQGQFRDVTEYESGEKNGFGVHLVTRLGQSTRQADFPGWAVRRGQFSIEW